MGIATLALALVSCDSEQPAGSAAQAPQKPQATPVNTVVLKTETINLIEEMPGRTVAFREIDVRPQVDGIIEKRTFEEGALVEQGQPLYQIDQAVYKASLDAAKAELASEQANLNYAQKTRDRYKKLIKTQASSQQNYDNAVADYAQALAAVAEARAKVDQAEINMNYTTVVAKITGKIGTSEYNEGSLVTTSQTLAMTTITQLDPIYVDVTQAGGRLLKIKQAVQSGRVQGLKEGEIEVSLIMDATGEQYNHKGVLKFSDVTVNETTGTVRLRAVFPNPNHDLLPGMFVRGLVNQGELEGAIAVPQKATMRRPDGSAYVYVVEEGKVAIKDIVIEQAQAGNWIVTAGLKEGDQLIVDGLQRIGPGSPVAAQPLETATAEK
ncbi:MAG: efflux RND transporter periplasmic adaptor subunit [Methylocystaceae bacterium]|nr:efflux RND transporter periplasmic adaptor subunit [Methylocystaceae bacterium]